MTGKTHRVGGMLGGLIGFSILKDKGLLVQEISEPLQLVIMYASSMYGSVLPDMDKDWGNCPSRDVFSWFIWRVLHLTTPIRRSLMKGGKFKKKVYKKVKGVLEVTDSKHRSWQTHSDLTIIGIIYLMTVLPNILGGSYDGVLVTVIGEGILFGIVSHLFLDMLTNEGIWSFILAPFKAIRGVEKGSVKGFLARLSLVPDTKFFSTNDSSDPWERLVRCLMVLMTILAILRVIYLWSPYRIVFSI